MYFTNKFESITYVTHIFHFGPVFQFNISFPKKKLDANLGSKWLNCARKKFENQIEFFKKTPLQSTVIYVQ
jgi:hypothetical protein